MSCDDYQMKMREAAAREMIRRQVLETYPSLACPDDLPEERFRIERFKSCCAMPFAERIAHLEAELAKAEDRANKSYAHGARDESAESAKLSGSLADMVGMQKAMIDQLEAERAELVEAVELLLDKRRWGRWDYMDDPELYQRADEVRRLIAKHKEQA